MDTSNTPGSRHELADNWLEPSPLTVEEMDTMRAIEIEIAAIESKFTGLELDHQMQELVERREDAINAMLAKVGAAKAEEDRLSRSLIAASENGTPVNETEIMRIKQVNDAFNEAADELNEQVLLDANNAEYASYPMNNAVEATLFDHSHVSDGTEVVTNAKAYGTAHNDEQVNLAA